MELEKLWKDLRSRATTGEPASLTEPPSPGSRTWSPCLAPPSSLSPTVRVYVYARSFAFGAMDAEAIAAPWAVVEATAGIKEVRVMPLGGGIDDLGLQGVRPLSMTELESLKDLWSKSPGAGPRIWRELNNVIAQRIDTLERARKTGWLRRLWKRDRMAN